MDWFLIGETATRWYFTLSGWWTVIQVVLGLGFVIFVHELGHFAVAKLCGVKCLKFYVGFDVPIKLGWGKYGIRLPASLWKKTWGETTYGIGIIPLGGYVKMLGQDDNPGRAAEAMRLAKEAERARAAGEPLPEGYDPDEDYALDPRSYMAQSVFERMAIISAGVVMNVIFAVIFAVVAFGMGTEYTPCVIGNTVPGDPVWLAGREPGDRIVEINRVPDPRFKDLQVEVILGDLRRGIPAVIQPYGSRDRVEELFRPDPGKIDVNLRATIGVVMAGEARLGPRVVAAGSPAAAAEQPFRAGDVVAALDGEPLNGPLDERYIELNARLARAADRPVEITVEREPADPPRDGPPATERVTITVQPNPMRWFGLTARMGPIEGVQRHSPAAEAGLLAGDRLVSIDGEPVGDPLTLPDRLRRRAGETVSLSVLRGEGAGREHTFEVPLREVRWSPQVIGPNCPLEIPALGICFPVEAVVEEVAPGGPAERAGLRPGDILTHAAIKPADKEQAEVEAGKGFQLNRQFELRERRPGRTPLDNWLELAYSNLLPMLEPDTEIEFQVERAGEDQPLKIAVLPEVYAGYFYASRGLVFSPNIEIQQAESFTHAVRLGARETRNALLQVVLFLKKLASREISPQLLGGPGTIVAVAGDQASRGLPEFLIFLTLLSANLAVINFLPIPVLDGGHMMFLLAEAVTGKPVSERIVIPLTYLGLFMILGLMIYVIGLDIRRFWPFGWATPMGLPGL